MAVLGNSSVYGNLIVGGALTANRVYGAMWNDYAEFFPVNLDNRLMIPGDVIVQGANGATRCTKRGDRKVIGVYSDTYGMVLGSDNMSHKVPIGLAGRVNVRIAEPCKVGDLLIAGKNGLCTVKRWYDIGFGRVVGKALVSKFDKSEQRIAMFIMMT